MAINKQWEVRVFIDIFVESFYTFLESVPVLNEAKLGFRHRHVLRCVLMTVLTVSCVISQSEAIPFRIPSRKDSRNMLCCNDLNWRRWANR